MSDRRTTRQMSNLEGKLLMSQFRILHRNAMDVHGSTAELKYHVPAKTTFGRNTENVQ